MLGYINEMIEDLTHDTLILLLEQKILSYVLDSTSTSGTARPFISLLLGMMNQIGSK